MSAETASDGEAELVGRCYTKARRSPLVVGVVRGGDGRNLRLVGGPYTITQLGAMVGTVVLLVLTRPVWGGHGWVDALVVVGAPFGAAFALRQLHVDGRNPLAAVVSVAVMLASPRAGRLHGRAFRTARPLRCYGVADVGTAPDSPAASPPQVKWVATIYESSCTPGTSACATQPPTCPPEYACTAPPLARGGDPVDAARELAQAGPGPVSATLTP